MCIRDSAILGGETIPLTPSVWEDKSAVDWKVDSLRAFNFTPDRAELAGSIELP